MYAFIKGHLATTSPTYVVIETQGIGYKIFIPASVYPKVPQIGASLLLHTSLVIRELSHALYGFLEAQERDLFEALLGVTGIGAKVALSLIGHLPYQNLYAAIKQKDVPSICKVPGIGKKTAERLIMEMYDKLSTIFSKDPSEFAVHMASDPHSQMIQDAMSALINLGYNQITAQQVIKKTIQEQPEELDLAALITNALKKV